MKKNNKKSKEIIRGSIKINTNFIKPIDDGKNKCFDYKELKDNK